MKFVAVIKGQNLIKYVKADGTEKIGKCTAEARAQALSVLQKGDLMKADYDKTTYEINKVEKYVKPQGNTYQKKSYNNNTEQSSTELRVLATAGNIISQIKGVDITNFEVLLKNTFKLGMELVKETTTSDKPVESKPVVEEEEEETILEEEEET